METQTFWFILSRANTTAGTLAHAGTLHLATETIRLPATSTTSSTCRSMVTSRKRTWPVLRPRQFPGQTNTALSCTPPNRSFNLQIRFSKSHLICRTSWWFHLVSCHAGFTDPSGFPLCFSCERSIEAGTVMRNNLLQETKNIVSLWHLERDFDSPSKALGHMLCFVWKFNKAEEDMVESVR